MRNELEVNVNREWLIGVMEGNLKRHRVVHAEAVEGYGIEAEKLLRKALAELEGNRRTKVQVVLSFPENHERDYERAIALVSASQDETVLLGESQFDCYVNDEWRWMRVFNQSARFYGSTTAEELPEC